MSPRITVVVLMLASGCQTWQAAAVPAPGGSRDLGHVLVGTNTGTVADVRDAVISRDTLVGNQFVPHEYTSVPVAIPVSNITSLQQSKINVGASVAIGAGLAALITTFALVAHNGMHHP